MSVRVTGLKEVARKIDKMSKAASGAVLEQSLLEAAEPFERDYRQEAPGFLKRSIRIRKGNSGQTKAQVLIGAKHRFGFIFEFGTKVRYRQKWRGRALKTGSALTGAIRPIGFARRAYDTNKNSYPRDLGRILFRVIKERLR